MGTTGEIRPAIHESWRAVLEEEFSKPYFADLKQFLISEKGSGTVYPPGHQIFAAFDHTPFDRVKVVVLGQDPYHGEGQAHGLSFSVPHGVRKPPSLANIFKEIRSDLGLPEPATGDLTPWARQGVLLLNATLTVRAHSPASHQGKGWERFTDAAIRKLSAEKEHLVFLLWGNPAQQKGALIDNHRHLVLRAPHPSPLSAHRGFFGCHHFSATNHYLTSKGITPIQWMIP
jgi:uracil-DNA glycosylase